MRPTLLTMLALCIFSFYTYSQKDTAALSRIAGMLQDFQPDTTTPPNYKITAKINELRMLKGPFNINEAIQFKIAEDRQKAGTPKEELDAAEKYFTQGKGKTWIDNAMTWIYRRNFTYDELEDLVKFYKSSAGKKLANNLPIIMLQSLKAAETIKGYMK
jgi:uncharacterized protein